MTELKQIIEKKRLTDDKVDALAILLIIAIIVSGVTYWLASMPS